MGFGLVKIKEKTSRWQHKNKIYNLKFLSEQSGGRYNGFYLNSLVGVCLCLSLAYTAYVEPRKKMDGHVVLLLRLVKSALIFAL